MYTEDELLEAFHRFQNALAANDTDTLDRLMAPDYRGFSIRGELEDRDAVLHDLHFCDLYICTSEGWKILLAHSVETPPPDRDTDDTDSSPSAGHSGGEIPKG